MQPTFPHTRLKRLRHTTEIRQLLHETIILPKQLIMPIFIKAGITDNIPITSMPGHEQIALSKLTETITELENVSSVILFGIPEHKDELGSASYDDSGVIQQAIKIIKDHRPDLQVIADVCFCEYTTHGHCGYIHPEKATLDNDHTLELLQKQAVSYAKAGADLLAPSGMVDGMVAAIRSALDSHGFINIPIMSYSVKYASSLYGPFRFAAEGAPQFGDRATYQMDPANTNEAIREAQQDYAEGADLLLIKPAHTYLDIIYRIKQKFPELPVGGYHTSGEFAMIKAAAAEGLLVERDAVIEVLTSIKRAGADFIISYFTKQYIDWCF